MSTIHVDVVSAEELIFSGEANFVVLPGEVGELGIYPKHTPLISRIKPGAVRIQRADNGQEEFVFVAGGILEVQPDVVDRERAHQALPSPPSPVPNHSMPSGPNCRLPPL